MAKSGLFGSGVRVGPINQTPIQPTGIPGSTFVRAPVRERGSNLTALASALGGFNSALQNFANVQRQQEEDPQSRANKEWIARRQQMSLDDLISEVQNETPDGNRIRQDAVELLLAERANDGLRQQWLEFYNTQFDQTSGDAPAEYERMRQEFAARLPSEVARGHLYRLTGQHFQTWMEQDVKAKAEYVRGEMHTTIVDSFRNAVDDARNGGVTDPMEIAKRVFAKSSGNRAFLGLSGQDQNRTIYDLAVEYAAQGDEELVRALLESPRTGADGKPIGPLGMTSEYRTKSLELIERAGGIRDQKLRETSGDAFHEDNSLILRGEFTKEMADKRVAEGLYGAEKAMNLVEQSDRARTTIAAKAAADQERRDRQITSEREEASVYAQAFARMDRYGGINAIRDVEIPARSGEGTRTLSRETIIDAVVDRKEEAYREHHGQLVAGGMAPEQARQVVNRDRITWYAGNGIVNEQWSSTLNGMAGRVTTDTLLQKGEVTDYLKQSAELYRQLRAVNPDYLSRVLTDKGSRDFLEAYHIAMFQRRMPEEEALAHAARMAAQPITEKARSMLSPEKTEDLTRSTMRRLGLEERAPNVVHIRDRITTLSMLGATEREIRKEIEEEILDTAVPINGVLVFAHHDLPDDFPDLIADEFAARVERYGEAWGVDDVSELALVADGSETKWYVVQKRTGMPVRADAITRETLTAHRDRRNAEREELARNLREAKDAEKAEYQRRYDAEIAEQRARVEFWENAAANRKGLRQTLAGAIAKRLREDFEERRARDAEAWKTTPAGRAEKRRGKRRQEAERNAQDLGFEVGR